MDCTNTEQAINRTTWKSQHSTLKVCKFQEQAVWVNHSSAWLWCWFIIHQQTWLARAQHAPAASCSCLWHACRLLMQLQLHWMLSACISLVNSVHSCVVYFVSNCSLLCVSFRAVWFRQFSVWSLVLLSEICFVQGHIVVIILWAMHLPASLPAL